MISHYVYMVRLDRTGEFYIGVRTARGVSPEQDTAYTGSGLWTKAVRRSGLSFSKTVIKKFRTRRSAERFESSFVAGHSGNKMCRNLDYVKRVHKTMSHTPLEKWHEVLAKNAIDDPLRDNYLGSSRTQRIIKEQQAREMK